VQQFLAVKRSTLSFAMDEARQHGAFWVPGWPPEFDQNFQIAKEKSFTALVAARKEDRTDNCRPPKNRSDQFAQGFSAPPNGTSSRLPITWMGNRGGKNPRSAQSCLRAMVSSSRCHSAISAGSNLRELRAANSAPMISPAPWCAGRVVKDEAGGCVMLVVAVNRSISARNPAFVGAEEFCVLVGADRIVVASVRKRTGAFR